MEIAITQVATEINPVVGDLMLDEKGDLVVHTTLAAEVAQRLFVRLNFFRSEWFLDLNEGTPYYEHLLRKAGDRAIRAIFGAVIRGTEGVAELSKFNYTVANRHLTLSFRARLTDGTVFNSSDFAPFVVEI